MADVPKVEMILVPAGAEYQAVQRALRRAQNPPRAIAIPAGSQALLTFLSHGPKPAADGGILLMGLGGSLSNQFSVGDRVLLRAVWDDTQAGRPLPYPCDGALTEAIAQRCPGVAIAEGVSCDRVITAIAEKRYLGDRYGAAVVEMEGASLLQALPNCPISILRVISDDCRHELPDISAAIAPDGSLRVRELAWRFLQRPIAALRLIRGSLQGLKVLEQTASHLFQRSGNSAIQR